MINENDLAKAIAEREGLKVQVDIAQIKEVLRVTLDILGEKAPSEVLRLVEKHECCQWC